MASLQPVKSTPIGSVHRRTHACGYFGTCAGPTVSASRTIPNVCVAPAIDLLVSRPDAQAALTLSTPPRRAGHSFGLSYIPGCLRAT